MTVIKLLLETELLRVGGGSVAGDKCLLDFLYCRVKGFGQFRREQQS